MGNTALCHTRIVTRYESCHEKPYRGASNEYLQNMFLNSDLIISYIGSKF